jgi:hypothetical protein
MQIDEKTLKSQVEMAQNMSDEQLRSLGRMQGRRGVKPGMDFDPAMMRQSMNMMKNMSPEQIKSMAETAKKMQASGQFPRGTGGFPGAGPTPSPPAYQPPKEVTR